MAQAMLWACLNVPGQHDAPLREIILLGHIDTVRGFRSHRARRQAHGRGAVDAKGPLAAFATAAAVVGPQPGWRIVVAGAVEEESTTSKGAGHLAARRRPNLCVIGEPTGWERMALGYKGRLLADVEFQRMMSHTAGPEAGAPERAFGYWRPVQAWLTTSTTAASRTWDQVQASLRQFSSGDDGMLETAEMRLGFRLPPSVAPDVMKQLLISADGIGAFRFSGEEQAFRRRRTHPWSGVRVRSARPTGASRSSSTRRAQAT